MASGLRQLSGGMSNTTALSKGRQMKNVTFSKGKMKNSMNSKSTRNCTLTP